MVLDIYAGHESDDTACYDRVRKTIYAQRAENHQSFIRLPDDDVHEKQGHVGICTCSFWKIELSDRMGLAACLCHSAVVRNEERYEYDRHRRGCGMSDSDRFPARSAHFYRKSAEKRI